MKTLILIILSFLLGLSAFTGRVVRIIDGDTIVILTERREQVKVRLEGIDCPESNQAFGTKARQTTDALCFGKDVRVEKTGTDQYGRTLGFVYVDNTCINKELVRLGMAWDYKYYNHDPEYERLEREAKAAKRGLWSQPNPIAPWEFRRKEKSFEQSKKKINLLGTLLIIQNVR